MTKLAISFDVNRTILIADSAAGKQPIDEIYAILAASMWGTITNHTFHLDPKSIGKSLDVSYTTFYHYLQDDMYPMPDVNDGVSHDEHAAQVSLRKSEVRDFLRGYFEGPLEPEVREALEMLKAGIDLPEGFSLLPSFYDCVCEYGESRDVTFVFRTFGNDCEELIAEFNRFCDGLHPLYPGVKFNGEDGTRDLRVLILFVEIEY
eukprot:TRINITY_DN4497_c0_g1_i3.p2 TRINITY_DN4497_c0_g1~~TRINITY_DN4497_c0_g1_i3.p2  ORF type:complete len:218 (+),score=34.66 TRINITY_DN4497_c0_g1_i3:42-656(+)